MNRRDFLKAGLWGLAALVVPRPKVAEAEDEYDLCDDCYDGVWDEDHAGVWTEDTADWQPVQLDTSNALERSLIEQLLYETPLSKHLPITSFDGLDHLIHTLEPV